MKSLLVLVTLTLTTISFAGFQAPQVHSNNQAICYENLCKKTSPFGCNNSYSRAKLKDACTRQVDLGCITVTLNSLSSYEKDEVEELAVIAKSCQYVKSQCHIRLKTKLSKYEKDDIFEIRQLNDSCYLVNPRCVSDVLSFVSRNQKDDLSEVMAIGKMCQGTYKYNCIRKKCNSNGRFGCDEINEVRQAAKDCVFGPSPVQRRRL